jgi:hypothetical protein
MEPCGVPSIGTPTFFVFVASNVPRKLETEETGGVNCTVVNTIIPLT